MSYIVCHCPDSRDEPSPYIIARLSPLHIFRDAGCLSNFSNALQVFAAWSSLAERAQLARQLAAEMHASKRRALLSGTFIVWLAQTQDITERRCAAGDMAQKAHQRKRRKLAAVGFQVRLLNALQKIVRACQRTSWKKPNRCAS